MKYFKKLSKIISGLTAIFMLTSMAPSSALAQDLSTEEFVLEQEKQYINSEVSPRISQAKTLNISNNRGTLTSNTWRQTIHSSSGNTYQWDYQVSAVYNGNVIVESIKTEWYASASLRNSASIDLGTSGSGITVGSSSSWTNIKTPIKYWENTNGAKTSDYRANVIITPKRDYRQSTISVINTAKVKLYRDTKTHYISSGV